MSIHIRVSGQQGMLDEFFFSACVMLCHFKRCCLKTMKSWKMSFWGGLLNPKHVFFHKMYSTPPEFTNIFRRRKSTGIFTYMNG